MPKTGRTQPSGPRHPAGGAQRPAPRPSLSKPGKKLTNGPQASRHKTCKQETSAGPANARHPATPFPETSGRNRPSPAGGGVLARTRPAPNRRVRCDPRSWCTCSAPTPLWHTWHNTPTCDTCNNCSHASGGRFPTPPHQQHAWHRVPVPECTEPHFPPAVAANCCNLSRLRARKGSGEIA